MTTAQKRQQAHADAKLREELIALGHWIAVNLYGKHAYEFHYDEKSPYSSCKHCSNSSTAVIHEWPHYPKNNAAALELLKLADTMLEDGYRISIRGSEVVMIAPMGGWTGIRSTGTTLEHGICLFVKALWEYRQKNPLP